MEKPEGKEAEKHPLLAFAVRTNAIYIALIVSLALYVLTKQVFFASLTAISLVTLFVVESYYSASKIGWKNELKELVITFAVAGVIWYGSGFILHTSAPLDSIVSCSMLPNLDRGDMVVLQGAPASGPEIPVTQAEFSSNDWQRQKLVCTLCPRFNASGGIYYEPCAANIRITPRGIEVGNETSQSGNLLQYECGVCTRMFANGSTIQTPCTKSVSVKGTRVPAGNLSSDVIVYTPEKNDTFKSETIHRVLLRLNAEGKYYYFTKGDNNEQLDIQFGNSPISEDNVVGRVVFRAPYLGYLKLFLFGFLATPQGCDSTLSPG